MLKIILIVLVTGLCWLALPGCDRQPRAPDEASTAHALDQRIEHERRLRDADRLRLERQLTAVERQRAIAIGLSVGLSLATLAASIWLGVEIRRRRALAQLLVHIQSTPTKGGDSCT